MWLSIEKKIWYYVLLMNSEIIVFEDCRILWTISLNRVKEYWYIWKYKCIWIKEKDWKQSEKKISHSIKKQFHFFTKWNIAGQRNAMDDYHS